jgi:hypothetical protein
VLLRVERATLTAIRRAIHLVCAGLRIRRSRADQIAGDRIAGRLPDAGEEE